MLTAGLRREDQRSFWISDHDEALDTFERRDCLGRLVSYLTFGLTGWRKPEEMEFGTTASPNVPESAEDVASIPDLIAGASCQLSGILPGYCGTEVWRRVVSPGEVKDRRALTVGNWMATTRGRLRQVLLRLELGDDGSVHSSAQFFAGILRS
jgi:hypothetical protein